MITEGQSSGSNLKLSCYLTQIAFNEIVQVQAVYLIISMRKLQKSDRFFIEKLRACMREETDLANLTPEDLSPPEFKQENNIQQELIKNAKIRSIRICNSAIQPRSESVKEHVVYQIQVMTDQLTYKLERRFRQFNAFHKKIKKRLPKECVFPKKNYNPFVSSFSPAYIEERKIKLNLFMQDVLQVVLTQKDALVTIRLYNFIQLQEHYQDNYSLSRHYQKSLSERSQQLQKYYTYRGHSSEKHLGEFSENSLQMLIALINQPHNPSKHLKKLEEVIKNKKFKASNDEIKIIFIGFQHYQGVLKFGLTNSLEANRLAALEILIDLLLPERNLAFERYQKMLQKIPTELWIVDDVSYLDSPVFKVHYFRLLKIFCQRVEKNHHKGEIFILKSLFLFHENLINDYLQWKKLISKEQNVSCAQDSRSQLLLGSLSSEQQLMGKSKSNLQKIEWDESSIEIYYFQKTNLLVLLLSTELEPSEIKKASFQWNRFVCSYQLEDYTELYRYCMKNKEKQWNIRVKVEEQNFTTDKQNNKKSLLFPEEVEHPIQDIISRSDCKLIKQQWPFQIYAEYEEEIYVQLRQEQNTIAILLKFTKDVEIFEGSLRHWAIQFAEDALSSFD